MIGLQTVINRIKSVSKDSRIVSSKPKIGRMCAFMYNPKTKDRLPYYDVFPLVIPVDYTVGGFFGINFHYLDVNNRRKLLYLVAPMNELKNNKKSIVISYQRLKGLGNGIWRYAFKRYLFTHIRSKIVDIPKSDWMDVIKLPVSGFVKSTARNVYKNTRSG